MAIADVHVVEDLGVEDAEDQKCTICFQVITESSPPSCSHRFCEGCLFHLHRAQHNPDAIRCPFCGQVRPTDDGSFPHIQTNGSLCDLSSDLRDVEEICTAITNPGKFSAMPNCAKEDDSRTKFDDINCNITEKEELWCQVHPKEEVNLICISCGTPVCSRCRKTGHEGTTHKVVKVSSFMESFKCDIQSLRNMTRARLGLLEKHSALIEEQKGEVERIINERIADIQEVYEDLLGKLTQQRNDLVGRCEKYSEDITRELDDIGENDFKMRNSITSAWELVGKCIAGFQEGHNFHAQGQILGELQGALNGHLPDETKPRNATRRAENIKFKRNQTASFVNLGEVSLEYWGLEKVQEIPALGKRAHGIGVTSSGKVATGIVKGGVEIFGVDGSTEIVKKELHISGVCVLSDGRFVLRSINNSLSVYSPQWERLKAHFITTGAGVADAGMCVDRDDLIYVAHPTVHLVQVFRSSGGKPIREIPCFRFKPTEICPTSEGKVIVVSNAASVRVISIQGGGLKNSVTKEGATARPLVLSNDDILVGWRKDSLLSVDLYTPQLQHVRTVLKDFKVDASGFFSLREGPTGDIVISTTSRFHIFRKS